MHLEDAIDVLLNGDGNDNPAQEFTVGSDPIGGAAGTLTYDDLVDFWAQFEPYEMNTLLVSGDMMRQMLKMDEFQNPLTGLNFQGTGKLATPLGATLLRTSALESGKLIGLDKNYALEMVQGSDVMVEYDKLIDRQLERAAITSISGFAKLFTDAAKVLKLNDRGDHHHGPDAGSCGRQPAAGAGGPVPGGGGGDDRTAAGGRGAGGLRSRLCAGVRLGGPGGPGRWPVQAAGQSLPPEASPSGKRTAVRPGSAPPPSGSRVRRCWGPT